MNILIIFATLMLVISIVAFFRHRKKAISYEIKNEHAKTTTLFILLFSMLVSMVLLTISIMSQETFIITLSSWYVVIVTILLLIFLFNTYKGRIQTFFYDLRCAASEISGKSSNDTEKVSYNYKKRDEITKLLNEVVESVKEDAKTLIEEDNVIEKNGDDGLNLVADNTITKKTSDKNDEKEKIRRNKNPEYAKEQEEMNEILAFLDKKGL